MKRLIFVGIHNKPGLPPSCSTTRSGKVIDACIEELKTRFRTIKSNFYDSEEIPKDKSDLNYFFMWRERVCYDSVNDIVVTLGEMASKCFISRIGGNRINMRHPSSWATKHTSKEDFVIDLLIKIEAYEKLEKQRILRGLINQRT